MLYRGVDIYRCKVFAVDSENGKLKFHYGKHRGKTPDDINTLTDLHSVIGYCFWIINELKNPFPLYSKYAASAFIKELVPKLLALEGKIREIAIDEQDRLIKETEEATKKTGTKYI